MKIIEYNGCRDIKVKFKTGTVVKARYDHFKTGNVKDPLFPSIYKTGYLGIGKYKMSINSNHAIGYKIW